MSYFAPKLFVDARYVWYNQGTQLVLMYFMNHIPFSFDVVYNLEKLHDSDEVDLECIKLADQQPRYSSEDVYRGCSYLISEQAHPCFNEVEIENADILPDDICGTGHDVIDYY